MAVEYNGKLYFACAGFPTSRLLQIDPETNETKVVMQKTAENSGFANGIRGLTVMDGKLLVSLATDGADPDNMFASGSQLPQAYQNAIKAMAKKTYVTKTITHVCRVYVFFPLQIQKT